MREMPDAVILCGGAGSRLKSVTGDLPKAMASVTGRPFLELLLVQLARSDFRRVILAVGHGKEVIKSYFGNVFCGIELVYSEESCPLGTGGALRNAAAMLKSDLAVVMNGDSYIDAELARLVTEHSDSGSDVTILLTRDNSRNDCGSVLFDGKGWISSFEEKVALGEESYVNAGVYVVSRDLLLEIPPGASVSIERELFPEWLRHKKLVRAAVSAAECVDIGTPDRYRKAQSALADAELSRPFRQE